MKRQSVLVLAVVVVLATANAWGAMYGLRDSMADMPCIAIRIKEVPLTAVRYGLTRRNIVKLIESKLKEENIRLLDRDEPDSNWSGSDEGISLRMAMAGKPELEIKVECALLKAGRYWAIVEVSMHYFWGAVVFESEDGELLPPIDEVQKQGMLAIEKTYKTDIIRETIWERRYQLIGKLDDFAEDEKNSLEDLVDEFINDYLAANPTKGKDGQAILEYTKAIDIDPNNAEAYYRRGLAYAKQGHRGDYFNKGLWDKAISDYTKAIELKPSNAEAYLNRGLAHKAKSEYEKAFSDFSKVIELEPRNAQAYFERGYAYRRQKLWDQAISDYSKAIELEPKNVEAYSERGDIYNIQDQWDQVISDYTKVIELEPRNVYAYLTRGNAYREKSEYDKAISDYSKAQNLGSQSAASSIKWIRLLQK